MQRHASKKQTNKLHDRSVDDFVKHLKRYNLKSERYDRLLSPDKFAPYRHNINHTLDKSRTLSGNKSLKTNKTTRIKIERMLSGSISKEKNRSSASKIVTKSQSDNILPNPADLISQFSRRIREAQRYLDGKSKMGLLLCKKFLEMLNEIVENMVLNLQHNLQELQKSISERLQREIGDRADKKVANLQKKVNKMERQTMKLLQKENFNNNLIYHLRLQNFDIDKQFGKCIFHSEEFGGLGYNRKDQSDLSSFNQLSHSEMVFVKRNEDPNDINGGEEYEWQFQPGLQRKLQQGSPKQIY